LPSSRLLLNRLARDYEIVVFAEVPIKKNWLDLEHQYEIKSVFKKNWPRRIRDFLLYATVLKEHLIKPFDLFQAHSNYPTGLIAVLLQKTLHVPALVNLEGAEAISLPAMNFGDLQSPRRRRLNTWIINQAKWVTTLTHYQRDLVCKNLNITRPMQVITRGVDLGIFKMSKKKISDPVVLLSVGYLSPVKNPEMFLQVCRVLNDRIPCKVIHIGEDFMEGVIHKRAEELGLSNTVEFKGNIPYSRLPDIYAQADILLVTSTYESQGVVIAEAMASGVLVCGTRVGLIADLGNVCCISSPIGDDMLLAEAVRKLLQDDDKMNQIRANAFQWSVNHDLENSAREFIKIYDQLKK
jgi:glycosyltransferase involved in cell wall biosynthesis